MLGVTGERGGVSGYFQFEVTRCHGVSSACRVKEVLEQRSVGAGKFAAGTQGVIGIDFSLKNAGFGWLLEDTWVMREKLTEEVFGEFGQVSKALQGGIHEASITAD